MNDTTDEGERVKGVRETLADRMEGICATRDLNTFPYILIEANLNYKIVDDQNEIRGSL